MRSSYLKADLELSILSWDQTHKKCKCKFHFVLHLNTPCEHHIISWLLFLWVSWVFWVSMGMPFVFWYPEIGGTIPVTYLPVFLPGFTMAAGNSYFCTIKPAIICSIKVCSGSMYSIAKTKRTGDHPMWTCHYSSGIWIVVMLLVATMLLMILPVNAQED